jgi:hypothetical protein
VLWLITGNNLRPAGDMPSRLVEIYLDANTDRPDRRAFARDLASWVADNRPAIVAAAVTVVRAYLVARCPKLDTSPTRFPRWDRMVRLPLVFAGAPDIGLKFDKAYANDPGLEAWGDVLRQWHEAFGDTRISARELIEHLDGGTQPFNPRFDRLRKALVDSVDGRRGDELTTKALGKNLGRYTNRPVGGFRLRVDQDRHTKVKMYSVHLLASGE